MDITAMQEVQGYALEHTAELIDPAFYNFTSSQVMTHDANNKGKRTKLVGSIKGSIVGPWRKLTAANAKKNAKLIPVKMETERGQFFEGYVPEELENSYAGIFRKPGQDPNDFPFEAYCINLIAKQIGQDNENAIWKAKKADVIDDDSTIFDLFDGILQQLETAITAGDIEPVVLGLPWVPKNDVQMPASGYSDIIDMVEAVVDKLPEGVQQEGAMVYMSAKNAKLWERAYRNRFKGAPDNSDIRKSQVDITSMTGDFFVQGCPGLNGSNRIIATPLRNIVYSYDVADDASTFNLQMLFNQWFMFGAYRIGATLLMKNDDWVACNEQP